MTRISQVEGRPSQVDGRDDTGLTGLTGGTRLTGDVTTALAALREEQTLRIRGLIRVAVGICVMAIGATVLVNHDSPGRWESTFFLSVCALVSAGLWVHDVRGGRLTERHMFLVGYLGVAALLSFSFYVGMFSQVIVTATIGIYFFGLSDKTRAVWTMLVVFMTGYLVLGSIVALGIVPADISVIGVKDPDPLVLWTAIVVNAGIMLLAFYLARLNRHGTLLAMDQLQKAQRQIKRGEALLNEARADLDQMLDAAKLGRHSGRQIGEFIAEDVIGRGAMGEVYAARNPNTDERAAIKLLHPHVAEDSAHVERFFREAKISSSVDSRHIVRVVDSGTTPDGSPYLTMEYLDGHDLAFFLRENRRLKTREVLDLVSQIAEGLSLASEEGIVHRDLKPQNLFATGHPDTRVWKILDFGVSTMAGHSGTLTQGAAVGTPSYMSPEQTRGLEVDHRSDVFALGIITYRALTGRPAFTARDAMSTMYNVVHNQPARPSEFVRASFDVERVLALALAKKPADRFSSANALAAALRDAVRNQLDERFRDAADTLLERYPWGGSDSEATLDTGPR